MEKSVKVNNSLNNENTYTDVKNVCASLGISHFTYNYESEFKKYVIDDFIDYLLLPSYNIRDRIQVHFMESTAQWNVEGKNYDRGNVKAYSTYGTGRINAYKYYFEHFLQYPFLGNGFLYPDSYETKLLLYGPAGHYYLDDVGVIGFIFTTGIAGLLWLIGLAIKVLKNIVIMYKSKVLYKNPEVIGVLAYIVVTMPTLFICSYGKICFLPILLYILTPSKK